MVGKNKYHILHSSIPLSTHLPPIHPPTHLPIYPPTHPSTHPPTHLPIHPPTHLPIRPFIHLCFHPSVYPSIHPPTHPPPQGRMRKRLVSGFREVWKFLGVNKVKMVVMATNIEKGRSSGQGWAILKMFFLFFQFSY